MRFESLETRRLLAANSLGPDTFEFSSENFDGAELRALQSGKDIVFSDVNRWYQPVGYNKPTFNDEGQLVAELVSNEADRHTMYVAKLTESQCFGADGIYTLPETHYQISFDVRFPMSEASWLDDHPWAIVMQLWGPRETGELARNPPLSIYASEEGGTPVWKLATRADSRPISSTREFDNETVKTLPAVSIGEWEHFDVEYVADPFGNGLVRVWLDGNLVVDLQDIHTGYNSMVRGRPSGPLNPAFGIYSPFAGEQMEVNFDHIRIDCNGGFGNSIAGTVLSATPGQLVTARNTATDQVFSTNANSAGVYTLNVTPGEYQVRAKDLGNGQFRTSIVDVTNRSVVTDFRINSLFTISGKVDSKTPGQVVTARNLDTDEAFTTNADSKGNYLLKVPGGEYRLRARDLGTGQFRTVMIDASEGNLVRDFHIEPERAEQQHRVTGTVISATPRQLVTAISTTTNESFRTTADNNGNYSLSVPAGTYRLRAADLGTGEFRTVDVDLATSDAIRNFEILRSISGQVTGTGSRYLVSATHTVTDQTIHATADGNGHYRISLLSGTYSLKATDLETGQHSTAQIDVTASDGIRDFRIENSLRAISGTVKSTTPGQLVTAINVESDAVFRTQVKSDGSYKLMVPPAKYRLRAADLGTEQFRTVDIDVIDGNGVRNFVIESWRNISGTVASTTPGQLVTAIHKATQTVHRVYADADGKYELSVDLAGQYLLRARDLGTGQYRTVEIDLTDTQLIVRHFFIAPPADAGVAPPQTPIPSDPVEREPNEPEADPSEPDPASEAPSSRRTRGRR